MIYSVVYIFSIYDYLRRKNDTLKVEKVGITISKSLMLHMAWSLCMKHAWRGNPHYLAHFEIDPSQILSTQRLDTLLFPALSLV
jgi:hypothetical protein